jgi:hypothetical protein
VSQNSFCKGAWKIKRNASGGQMEAPENLVANALRVASLKPLRFRIRATVEGMQHLPHAHKLYVPHMVHKMHPTGGE